MQKFNFSYDKDNDDLFLANPKSKSKGSIEIGDIIFDYNNKKEFVGIQIIHASNLIRDITEENIQTIKQVLNGLKDCKVEAKVKRNLIIVKIVLISKLKEISPVISIPSIRESSPALAYA